MRDDDHTTVFFVCKALQYCNNVLTVFGIEVACGFIRKDDLRVACERTRDGHTLLLAAREHGGKAAKTLFTKTNRAQLFLGGLLRLLGGQLFHFKRVHRVFERREEREQIVVLIDYRNGIPTQPVGVNRSRGFAPEQDVAFRR